MKQPSTLSLGYYQHFMGRPTDSNRITICRTVGEMEFIRERLKEMGRSEIRPYLTSKISNLVDTYNKCPDCITPAWGDRQQLEYFVRDRRTYQTLKQISFLLQKSVSAVVDDFIIAPILAPNLDR